MLKLTTFILILWSGLILGVSFIATPVKFMAQNLTMPVAMEIGKVTFRLFNKLEWGICIIIIVLLFFGKATSKQWLIVTA